MTELLNTLSLWLIDYFVVATVLLAGTALALWRIRQPAQRMALAWGTMAGLTALLLATAVPAWPRWDVRKWLIAAPMDDAVAIEKPIITYHERTSPLASDGLPRPIETWTAPALLPTQPDAAIERHIDWPAAVTLAWLCGAATAIGWIVLGAVQAWRLLWTAKPSPLWAQTELARLVGQRRKPRLKTTTRMASAVVLGTLRPAILLPDEHVREENRAGVQAALAHEWAHIRHGDLWLLAWQRLLLPLLAAHPLFWLLRRQIRADQELLADVAAAGEKPVEYAEALLAWAKHAAPRPSIGLATLAMWENPQTVSRRIQMILDPKNPVSGKTSRWWRWLIALCLVTIACGLSLLSIRSGPAVAQEDPPPAEQETQAADRLFQLGWVREQPRTAQIQQVELAVTMVRLGKAGEETTQDSIRDMARHFGDQISFDNGVSVVALPRQQVESALTTLRDAGQAKVLAQPKLMTLSGRDAVFADGGQTPLIETQEFADGRRIEKVEYQSLRSLRIRPEVRTLRGRSDKDPRSAEGAVVRLSVIREKTEPIDTPPSSTETDQTRPKLITRQLTFTADVPIGRTLLVWELKPAAADEANLVLITPEGIHRVTREVLANPKPLVLDSTFPAPHDTLEVLDPKAAEQIQTATDKLRAEAERNVQLAEQLKRENARLHQQIQDLVTQLKWLRSVANQDSKDQVSDAEFIRRVYLDLMGIVPTPEDVKAFLDSSDAKKREKLIDKLLADSKVADHWSRRWKDLIARREAPPAETKTEDSPPPSPQRSVSVFRLQHLPSDRALELVKGIFPGDGAESARLAADARTNSILFHGAPQQAAMLEAILNVVDQPAASIPATRRAATEEPGDESRARHDPATERQLLEIDLEEAQSELELVRTELAENKKMPSGAVSLHELRKGEAAVRQAELRVKRIKIMLDSAVAKEKSASRSPLQSGHEPVVPPKNLPERIWQRLGLKLAPVEEAEFKKLGSPFSGGLRVTEVRQGSSADEQGIVKSDILVGLDRWETKSLDNVAFVLANQEVQVSGAISFHILRDGKALVGRMPLAFSNTGNSPWANLPPATADNPAAQAGRAADAADQVVKIRLAEIDLREAKLKLDAATKEHARIAELARQKSVSQTEVDRIELERQHAELAVERAQTVLQSLQRPSAPPETRN